MPIELDFSAESPRGPRKIMLYGEPGTGKMFSLRTMPPSCRPIYFIDLDRGSSALHGHFPGGDIKGFIPDRTGKIGSKDGPVAYEQVKDRLQKIHKDGVEGSRTVVIDSFTELYSGILDHVMFGNNKDLSGPPSQPDYGIALRLATKFVEALTEMQQNVIVICHESTHQNDTTGVVKVTPALTGQLAVRLPGYFDEVLHCVVKGRGDKAAYQWETRPSGLAIARSRNPDLPSSMPQDFGALLK